MIRDPWIRVHAHLVEKPVVCRMAQALRIDPFKATGHLVTFWGSVAQHGKNGSLKDLPDSLLERWAGWTGKRGAFAAWVRAEHTDDEGRINEWDTYQGTLEQRREKERERLRNKRRSVAPTDAQPLRDGPQSVATHARERNGTEQRSTTKTASAAVATDPKGGGWPVAASTLWSAKVGPVGVGKIGALLKPLVDVHGWPAVEAGMRDYLTATPLTRANLAWFAERGTYWVDLAKQPGIDPATGQYSERSRVVMGLAQ